MAHRYCFAALEWLCDFSSVIGREEAVEMAAHIVRFSLITLVSDRRKNNNPAVIFTVRGSAPGGNSLVSIRWHSYLALFLGTKIYDDCSSYLFFRKRVNFDAQPRRSTRLRMKAYERHAGTPEQSAPRTCPPAQRQTSAPPSVPPLMRSVAPLKTYRPLMPRFIGGYYSPRSSTPLTR